METTRASLPIHVRTLTGLEPVLAKELATVGARDLSVHNRLVRCTGDREILYQANLWCRTAIRVLQPIHTFRTTDESSLYDGFREVDWRDHLVEEATLAVDAIVHNSFCTHSLYAAQLAKDAIVDQFRDRSGNRPSVDLKNPTLRIGLYLVNNEATIYLDASGESLHKRGYRLATSEAPLNEVLAAGIVALSEWQPPANFVDLMCGSGTFLIEAALQARNIAPGLSRSSFGFERWPNHDVALWKRIKEEARDAIRPSCDAMLLGRDRDAEMIQRARSNALRAGVDDDIRFEVADLHDASAPRSRPDGPPGIVVMNPPYDERLKIARASALYRRIGDVLKQGFGGDVAFLLTGNLEAAKHVGLRTSKRVVLYNGPIECRLLRYELRAPKRKEPPEPIQATDDAGDAPKPPRVIDRWQPQLEMFANRLRKMAKHWGKWARRQGITCYRVYDRDLPETPLAIDLYDGRVHVSEFERPHDRSDFEQDRWLDQILELIASVFDVASDKIFVKERQRQRGSSQYRRQAETGNTFIVTENDLRFRVNLTDYLDTGLFLDHREARKMIRERSSDCRVLNLFGYTGSFTVYAAAGGARTTTTVDLSETYLRWAKENLVANGLEGDRHQFVRDDAMGFLGGLARRERQIYDLIVVDPPTFSNSKRARTDFDIRRDHPELLNLALERLQSSGAVFFSTNCRKFQLDEASIQATGIREITGQTVPPDFQRKRPHRSWWITKNVT
ncbi:Ribosomal RNA large subunit methyltransferase K/L [Planctomycetes bacterium Pan216]|uniref:Ribosomal RNA large subunit methyltransferase K/L n=1 Tax=Kolteria novifilia TaxID=2527975 RepID=A0A518B7V4_9BACT|nr:Ribosomal RNA large subunit methyltransferase K/L [Planctomycetes bacterium Pan216]